MKNNKIKITILLIVVLVISIFCSGCFKTDNAYEYTVIFQDYDGTEIKIETGLKKGPCELV